MEPVGRELVSIGKTNAMDPVEQDANENGNGNEQDANGNGNGNEALAPTPEEALPPPPSVPENVTPI
ncbi:hypothetical protein CASFOL_036822 [Castilleja foliolosa]|uniref:Uncharacterized protein n=1 Tax=Castilleja foliolosa TaxID=1961234 RepID=A0ABD3BPP3_9LAMI